MRLGDVANQNFVLLDARSTAVNAELLVRRIGVLASIVVVSGESAFLLDEKEATDFLRDADRGQTIGDLLDNGSHGFVRIPIIDADAPADDASGVCVVSQDGIIVGVFDASGRGGRDPTRSLEGVASPGPQRGKLFSTRGQGEAARTWYLNAEFPDRISLGETRSLVVSVFVTAAGDKALPMVLPAGAAVDLVLQVKRGFAIQGASEARFVVSEEEQLPVQFKLEAITAGAGKLQLLAFYDGQALGSIVLVPRVVEEAAQAAASELHAAQLDVPSLVSPDLTLLILEHLHQGEPAFTIRLHAQDPRLGLNFKPFGPIALRCEPRSIFNSFFQGIEQLKIQTAEDRANTFRRLAHQGSWLFESLFPPELRTLIWSLQTRIQTVQIQSDEPWIPWEMCRLQTEEHGRIVDGRHFCEAFELTRWMPGIGKVTDLRLSRVAVIAPRDSGLPLADAEKEYLFSLKDEDRKIDVVAAAYVDVLEALADGVYDGIHFTGHGTFRDPDPNRSGILLEHDEELRPTDITGRTRNLGTTHPIVFLNACQSGRSELSLSDIGGWAAQFLRAGAGAFLGSYWSIYDEGAYAFARSFYDSLLDGKTVAQAVRSAREAVKAREDPTFLAYTVFAEPTATVRG